MIEHGKIYNLDSFTYQTLPHKATLRTEPQRVFQPQRLMIPTAQAGWWVVHDIRMNQQTQFAQDIEVPGEYFSQANQYAGMEFPVLQTGIPIDLIVSNVDTVRHKFQGVWFGKGVNPPRQEVLAIPDLDIPPRDHRAILTFDDGQTMTWGFQELQVEPFIRVVCPEPLTTTGYVVDGGDYKIYYLIDEATDNMVLKVCPEKDIYLCDLKGIR